MAKKYVPVRREMYSHFTYSWTSTFDDKAWERTYYSSFNKKLLLFSEIFSHNGLDMWRLELNRDELEMCLYLHLVESKKSPIAATCSYSIYADGYLLGRGYLERFMFNPEQKKEVGNVKYNDCSFNVTNARCRLIVSCEISVALNVGNCSQYSIPVTVPDDELTKELNSLYETLKFSDVTIKVNGRELRAYKVILALRSRVFCAMFDNEMAEKQNNEVNVTDIDHEVFQEVLRFVYTGKVNDIEKMADRLLAAADKYEMVKLKVMCEEALHSNLAIENAADTLILADLHSAEQLKARTVDFMNVNLAQVLKTESFLSMTKSHPILMVEVLHASAKGERNDAV